MRRTICVILLALALPASAADFSETIPRGDTRTYRFYIEQAGKPIDLAGWTVTGYYRRSLTATPATFPCPLDPDDGKYALVVIPTALTATKGAVLLSITATKDGAVLSAIGTITVVEHG